MKIKLRNTIVKITLTMLAATSLVGLLAWMALRPINQKNGFNRHFLAASLELLQVTKKDEAVNGIAGTRGQQFYFRTNSPARLWITDNNLQNGHFINLGVPAHRRIASAFYCEVDSPIVHIMAGNGPAIIQAPLSGEPARIFRFPRGLFTRAVRLSASTYVFRGFDTMAGNAGQFFIKGNPFTGVISREEIAASHTDAVGISSDGHMNYDASTSRLFYVS